MWRKELFFQIIIISFLPKSRQFFLLNLNAAFSIIVHQRRLCRRRRRPDREPEPVRLGNRRFHAPAVAVAVVVQHRVPAERGGADGAKVRPLGHFRNRDNDDGLSWHRKWGPGLG